MNDRLIEVSVLEREISQRAVAREGSQKLDSENETAELAGRMVVPAVRLLIEGQYREAATLFNFAVEQNPRDAAARNNLGFCLMPSDPASALRHLENANDLGYDSPAVNASNRILAHFLMGNYSQALEIAEQEWPTASKRVTFATILWIPGEARELTLDLEANPIEQIARLAEQSARIIGKLPEAAEWSHRARLATGEDLATGSA